MFFFSAERPPGYDRVRNAEIGNKDFELDVLEEAYTTEHWLVRIYKVGGQELGVQQVVHVGAVLHHAKAASHGQHLCFVGQRSGQPRALQDIKLFHRIPHLCQMSWRKYFYTLFGLNKKATWGFVDALTRFFIPD